MHSPATGPRLCLCIGGDFNETQPLRLSKAVLATLYFIAHKCYWPRWQGMFQTLVHYYDM